MESIVGALVGLVIGLVIIAIITLVFRWLWNTTMPDVFGLKTLSFGQALKIMIISSMLFGGTTKVIERGHEVVPEVDAAATSAG